MNNNTLIKISTPLTNKTVSQLKTGNRILLSGTIFTGRDLAHKRIVKILSQGEKPPFPLTGAIIYYVGPSPAPPGQIIGAAGPTTSYRMDTYTPYLIAQGLKAMIGKGKRGKEVKKAIIQYKSIYLAAIGGIGALIANCIKETKIIAFPELKPEAIHRLVVKDMPLFVVNDIYGGDLYQQARQNFQTFSK